MSTGPSLSVSLAGRCYLCEPSVWKPGFQGTSVYPLGFLGGYMEEVACGEVPVESIQPHAYVLGPAPAFSLSPIFFLIKG